MRRELDPIAFGANHHAAAAIHKQRQPRVGSLSGLELDDGSDLAAVGDLEVLGAEPFDEPAVGIADDDGNGHEVQRGLERGLWQVLLRRQDADRNRHHHCRKGNPH